MRRILRRSSMSRILAVAFLLVAFTVSAAAQTDSKTPRAVLESYVDAWNRHDVAAIDRLIGPDGIHDDIPNAVHAKGPEQVKDFMKSIIAQEPDFKWHIDRVIVSGSSIAAEWTWTATFTGAARTAPRRTCQSRAMALPSPSSKTVVSNTSATTMTR